MAPRAKAKKAGSGARARAAKAKAAPAAGTDEASLAAENAALRAALTEVKAEIVRLQKRQELVVNRIEWVIDSLHNLLEDED